MGVDLVLEFGEIERGRIDDVGGKGLTLGELSRIAGVRVPPGCCVTTAAFRRHVAGSPSWEDRLDRLARVGPDDPDAIAALAAEVRDVVTGLPVPDDVAAAVTRSLAAADGAAAYAVRSSATAEDLPTASFAGQYDSFLNVVGATSVLEHVRACWASLFTERAVTYRLRHGVDQRSVGMAVVVQRLVTPDASGVLFTADPLTGDRRVTSVEAVLGLGEALVSGVADADRWTVRGGAVADTVLATKKGAVRPTAGGGTRTDPVEPDVAREPALTDAQVVRLAEVGRRIEAHFGAPQDVEWCLVDDEVRVVQSRPITTSFPVPPTVEEEFHVYISVGHQQMMTDAMTPLGLSMWQMTTPAPMAEAGSRLFVDVTARLASPPVRDALLAMWGQGDPRVRNALQTVLDRGDVVEVPAPEGAAAPKPAEPAMIDADPALVAELIARGRDSVAAAAREIARHRGPDLFDAVVADLGELRRLLFDARSHEVFMTAMNAAFWLDEHLSAWLGEEHVADTLTLSVPDNVTSQMGLALLDVADVVRRYPRVVAFLRSLREDDSLDGLLDLAGGRETREALDVFLEAYGMRCVGEIDLGRPRWGERPAALVPVVLGHVDNTDPGAGRRRFEQGREEAEATAQDVLDRVRALPDGERKAAETAAMIDRLRTFTGYREFPKFGMVSRYWIYRRALLDEADRLVDAGVLDDREDIALLRFDELHEVVRAGQVDGGLLRERREALARDRGLTPPRVLTSHGEGIVGDLGREDLPAGALAGLAVSRGVVEGRARVVLAIADADLEPGDVLVTAFTDPSWSPAFVAAAGLVTEVGGTMTHGAVVAREYGLPAVVGVEGATRRIRDGQRIRVDGTHGWVEILEEEPGAHSAS